MKFVIFPIFLIVAVVAVYGGAPSASTSDENKDGLDDRHDLNRDGKPDHGYGHLDHDGYDADYRYPYADYGRPFVYDHRFYNGFGYGNDHHGYGSPYYYNGFHGYRA